MHFLQMTTALCRVCQGLIYASLHLNDYLWQEGDLSQQSGCETRSTVDIKPQDSPPEEIPPLGEIYGTINNKRAAGGITSMTKQTFIWQSSAEAQSTPAALRTACGFCKDPRWRSVATGTERESRAQEWHWEGKEDLDFSPE